MFVWSKQKLGGVKKKDLIKQAKGRRARTVDRKASEAFPHSKLTKKLLSTSHFLLLEIIAAFAELLLHGLKPVIGDEAASAAQRWVCDNTQEEPSTKRERESSSFKRTSLSPEVSPMAEPITWLGKCNKKAFL